MKRLLRCSLALAVAILAATSLVSNGTVSAGEQGGQPATLPLPLRLTAWAVNMGNIGTGRNNVIDIRITRWTTPEERTALLTAMVEKGSDALMKALLKLPDHGRIRIPGWQGPDPAKVVLGWQLHYAWNVPDGDGGQRIVLATDRYITFAEARNNPRVSDYPFTLLDIRLDKNGEGTGRPRWRRRSPSTGRRTSWSSRTHGSEPVRLQQVKIQKRANPLGKAPQGAWGACGA